MEEARRNFEIPVIRQEEFQLYNRGPGAYMRRLASLIAEARHLRTISSKATDTTSP